MIAALVRQVAAVVGGEDDQRVVHETLLPQRLEDGTYTRIDSFDHLVDLRRHVEALQFAEFRQIVIVAAFDAVAFVVRPLPREVDGKMCHIQEEWRVSLALDEVHTVLRDQIDAITLLGSELLVVPPVRAT